MLAYTFSLRQAPMGLLVLLPSILGCDFSSPAPPVPKAKNATSVTSPQARDAETPDSVLARLHTGPPITDLECTAYATELLKYLRQGDDASADRMFDWEAMGARARAGTPQVPSEYLAKGTGTALVRSVIHTLSAGGNYTFLRKVQRGAATRILFRLTLPTHGVNYHEVTVVRGPEGLKGVDFYALLSGEDLSQSLRGYALMAMAADGKEAGEFTSAGPEIKNCLPVIREFTTAAKVGAASRPDDFFAAYQKLPAIIQNQKSLLVMRMAMARQLGDDEFLKTLDANNERYPKDPCFDMISFDGFVIRKQYQEAHEALARIDLYLGGDSWIDWKRGTLYLQEDKIPEALAASQRALEQDSEFLDVWWLKLDISVKQGNFAETAKLIRQVQEKFTVPIPDFTSFPLYAEFVKSPEYQEWLQEQKILDPAKGKFPLNNNAK